MTRRKGGSVDGLMAARWLVLGDECVSFVCECVSFLWLLVCGWLPRRQTWGFSCRKEDFIGVASVPYLPIPEGFV